MVRFADLDPVRQKPSLDGQAYSIEWLLAAAAALSLAVSSCFLH